MDAGMLRRRGFRLIAVVALVLHPPAGGWSAIKPQFYLGILLAALGGCLVTYYKPNPALAKPQASVAQAAPSQSSGH